MPVSFPENTLDHLAKDLRDLWEGGFSWRDAIEMIGAPERDRPELRRRWNAWNRKYYGSFGGAS